MRKIDEPTHMNGTEINDACAEAVALKGVVILTGTQTAALIDSVNQHIAEHAQRNAAGANLAELNILGTAKYCLRWVLMNRE